MATYPRMVFSPETYAKHMANLDRVLQLALADPIAWHEPTVLLDKSWARPLDKNGWRIFAQTNSTKATYVCTGRLHTTLDALRAAFYNERTPAYRSTCAVLYEGALVDAAVLNVSQRRSSADAGHFLGVKVLKLAISPVVGDLDSTQHDFAFVEYAGTRWDRHGRETYFVISEPMADPTKPKDACLSNESLATVKLYHTADDSSVAVTVRAVIRFAAKAKKQRSTMVLWKDMGVYLPRSLTKDFLSVTREAFAYQALLLTTGAFALTLSKHTKTCSVCTKSSSLLRRHGHCQRCGHAMCSACTVKLYCVDRPSRRLSDKLMVQEKFCKQCFVEAKTMRLRSGSNMDDVASVHCSNDSVIYIDDPIHASCCDGQASSRSGSVVSSVVGSTSSSHDDMYTSSSMSSMARKGSVASTVTTWTSSMKDDALSRKVSAGDVRAGTRQDGRPARRGSTESRSVATTSSSWSSLTKEEMALRIDEMHESIAHQNYLITSMNEMLVQPRPARGYGASGGNPALLPPTFEVDAIQRMERTDDRRRLMAALLHDVAAITTTPGAVATLRDAIHSKQPASTLTPDVLKDRGNAAFKAKHYKEAIAAFSEGLRLLTIDDEPTAQLQSILFTNRCAAWHALGALEHAFADATRAITSYPPYPKAWFRRAKVLEACIATDSALAATLCASLRPDTEPLAMAQDDLGMAKTLVETPRDVDPFQAAVVLPPRHMDEAIYAHPNYHKHVRVATSAHAGRYLEVTHAIPAGSVVLVEDPVASAGLDHVGRCELCFAACESLVPCDACTCAVYCSDACQAAATPWHDALCATHLDCPSRLLLRLALQFRVSTAVRSSEDVRPWHRRDVYDLKRLLHRAPLPALGIARNGFPDLVAAMATWAVDGSCHALCHRGRVHGYVFMSRAILTECIVYLDCDEGCLEAPPTWLQGVVSLVSHQSHVTLRSTSRVLLDALQSAPDMWRQVTPHEYRFVGHRHEELLTLHDDVDFASPATLVSRVLYAAALAAVQRQASASTIEEMAHRLLAAASRVAINQVAITTTSSTTQGGVDVVGQARLGTGLFPAMAMCNHSCAPNASVHFTGRTLRLVTTRAVAQGDEIAISYGPHRAKMPTTQRQRILNEQYGFACHCAACRATSSAEANETTRFLAASKRAADAIHDRLARGDDAAALHTEIDALVDARVASLPRNHVAIAEALDLRAQLLAMHGAFAAASDACLAAIAVLETHYDPLDAELGHEYLKAAQLLFNAARWPSCRMYLARAKASLTLHLPATDALHAEMTEMQSYVALRT
ncbi:hypothetical protein SPRG_06580 [Saprolegnia parasitica CBS 223.65]|uniref:SET domain-containing protein n=1 Tax=Saprolegnia parasitica (strain CBS 223.65) TaxID=695850 RepID=A0A067CP86_SAPPC|nr:hypothetical protein SPRG_06580 [Saprolegnia parasitica CBS 223.65]KDO28341.1 hypothetical protein SPRG_06580 [Saprolegnia parasitica CBS 223.65]|eukprot:XP_012200789.1 hypothetical protein SPRG_06580 [Saprolegnia parasitica CBS 223.65]